MEETEWPRLNYYLHFFAHYETFSNENQKQYIFNKSVELNKEEISQFKAIKNKSNNRKKELNILKI